MPAVTGVAGQRRRKISTVRKPAASIPNPAGRPRIIRKIAASTAIPAEGKASDHSKALGSDACDSYCSIAISGVVPPGVSGSLPATRICGAPHRGQKGVPSSTLAPHL